MASNGEQQHTPTPWALRSSGLFVGNLDGNLRYVARLEHTDEQGWADGVFMLRAVNTYDALLAACKAALEARVEYNGPCAHEPQYGEDCLQCELRKAIALAEKES